MQQGLSLLGLCLTSDGGQPRLSICSRPACAYAELSRLVLPPLHEVSEPMSIVRLAMSDPLRFLLITALALTGCSGADAPATSAGDEGASLQPGDKHQAANHPDASAADASLTLPSISLGGTSTATTATSGSQQSANEQRRSLLDAMYPLQIMLGQWRGTTQKEVGDFKALDQPEWIWDFQTDENQPALVMTSAASPHFRKLRLTYLTGPQQYQVSVTEPDGHIRTLRGTFSQPVEEFQGDDKRLHRRYKLELTEVDAPAARDAWQLVFNQQDNNRYLVELSRQRGSRFMRFDTVANQREGTSFALDDADYGERKCLISGGLGTMTVSHAGKTYWVCCSGCKAAFEENPEKWIAAARDVP
jgi:hypothetical protein